MTSPKLSYLNEKFLESKEARNLRIMSEFLHVQSEFDRHDIRNTIVIFGSARTKTPDAAEIALQKALSDKANPDYESNLNHAMVSRDQAKYYTLTYELAKRIAEWSVTNTKGRVAIATGGGPGLMEAANKGAFDGKGKSVGLGIKLPFEQSNNSYITAPLSFSMRYFFIRKFWLAAPACGLVAAPGGFGTMDELFEILTLIQTGKMKAVPVVLLGVDYWTSVINFKRLAELHYISAKDLELFKITDNVDEALAHLTASTKLQSLILK